MKWTRTLIPTSKENPAEATTVGHQLLVRAGMVRQVAAGLFDWLPLGGRVMGKAEEVFAEEFGAVGGLRVRVGALRPGEGGERSGEAFGVKDRRGRVLTLPLAGAGAMVRLVAGSVRSHRQLPVTLFRIGASFRDEERPRRGLIDSREYVAAEACSVAADAAGLDQAIGVLREAVTRALGRCGLPFEAVMTNGGCEFFTRCEAGDDVVVASDDGNYVATLAEARTGSRPWTFGGDPVGELEVVPTPGASAVGDVARFLRVPESDVLKTMVFRATPSGEWTGYEAPENLTTPLWVVAVVRGDHEVNVGKLAAVVREEFHITSIALAAEEDAGEFAFGYVGPDAAIRKLRAALVVDPDAAQDRAWVAGANEPGYHVRNFNWFRECGQPLADPRKVAVADIRNAVEGDPAPGRGGGGKLRLVRGITLGRVTPLPPAGDNLAVTFQDEGGGQRAASVAACEVNLSRVVAAAVETGHDEHGIVWPNGMAPYSVVLTPIQYGGATKEAADRIYADLLAAGVDVLLDDRDLGPGTKFADADLIGIPIRVNVGERGLQRGVVEVKRRDAAEAVEVEVGRVVDAVLGR